MSNLVLFSELRSRLDDHLDRIACVAVQGAADVAVVVMRQDVPGLVAALRVLAAEHEPDENGRCRKCRTGLFWRRVSAPCRMLLDVHLAVEAATATTRERACWSPRRHRFRPS